MSISKCGPLIEVIKYPLFSEKVYRSIESNQYCFAVAPRATKPEITAAVQLLFDVKVDSVTTAIPPQKRRRRRLVNPKYKRALVKLAGDAKIALFEK